MTEISRDKTYAFRMVLSAFLMTFALSMHAQNNVIDEVAWVVGDEAIWKSEIEDARLQALYEGRKFDKDPYCVLPEELAVQKLYLHQAELDSIQVSDNEVIAQVDDVMSMYIQNIGSREKVEEYFNKTSTEIREDLRNSAKESLTVNKMQQKIIGEIKVTPAQVRRFYASLPQDSIPFVPTTVEVEVLARNPKVPQEEIDDVKRRLREYTDRVNNGESFTMLARLYSEDPGSAVNGGELPRFMGKAELDQSFANVAFSLTSPDKISKIVESEFGYHIIQLVEKRGDRIKVRHILLKPHIPDEDIEFCKSQLDSLADEIREQKFTFEEAAFAYSEDKNTRNSHGLMANELNNTSRFEMQDLPAEIAKVVDGMEVGEVSKAFEMVNTQGKTQCVIVKLKSRSKGHKATVGEDFQRLKALVVAQRQNEVLDEWVREKQKSIYVKISPNWRTGCEFRYPGWIKE